MINKKNLKVIEKMKIKLESKGFTEDRYGNMKDRTGIYRYKFNTTSYRYETRIQNKPIKWIKLSGEYYKNVNIE